MDKLDKLKVVTNDIETIYQLEDKQATEDIINMNEGLTSNSSELYNMYEYSENRMHWSYEDVTQDAYLENNGTVTSYAGWWISTFLEVEPNTEYVYITNWANKTLADNVYYNFFDINKKFISGANGKIITTTADTAFIKVSLKASYFNGGCTLIKKELYDAGLGPHVPYSKKLKEVVVLNNSIEELKNNVSTIETKTNTIQSYAQPNYDKTIRSIQRIGDKMTAPHHSIDAFIEAYKLGFRILLCDLRFTADNVPVLFHDDYLNQHYADVYDSAGALVDKNSKIYINQLTYDELSAYDYGYYKDVKYKGYPLMTLTDMLTLVKKLGVELYIEVKAMTAAQAKIACDLVKSFGLAKITSWAGNAAQMQYVINNIDTARVGTMPQEVTTNVITELENLKTGKNEVFVFGWNTTTLTADIVQTLISKSIAFEIGTIDTAEGVINYFEQGAAYQYCTGIESNSIIAGKVLTESIL